MFRVLITHLLVLAASGHAINFTHESDSSARIEILRVKQSDESVRLSFRFCDGKDLDNCSRIGKHESVGEKQLRSLEHGYYRLGQIVFAVEALVTTGAAIGLSTYLWRHPAFAAAVSKAATSETPPQAMMAAALESSPVLAAVSQNAKLSTFATRAADAIGFVYKAAVQPAILTAVWQLKHDLIFFIESAAQLSEKLLRPADSFRAAKLLRYILNAQSDLVFSKRDYASFKEFAEEYQIENMRDLRKRMDDLLVVAE